MKKMFNLAFIYMIAGLVAGVFYREFTKFLGFVGNTNLSLLHTHLLSLGMIMFLVVGIIVDYLQIEDTKRIKKFTLYYNIGLIITSIMLLVRGIVQVKNYPLSSGFDAAISGLSGLGHIILTVGLMYFFTEIKKYTNTKAA